MGNIETELIQHNHVNVVQFIATTKSNDSYLVGIILKELAQS